MQAQRSSFIKNTFYPLLFLLFMPVFLAAQTTPPGNIMNQRVLGEHKILLIRVQYPGDSGGIVSDAVMRNVAAIVKESLETNSYGAVTISTDITPVLMMPRPDAYYQFAESDGAGPVLARIRADAMAVAEQAGFPEANYDREVIYTKKLWKSRATGLGTVNFRTSFMACGCAYLTVHELGHSFDWNHAKFWLVKEGSPISPNGLALNYGDAFDIMGDQIPNRPRGFHHFNPWYKSRAGWLPEENILTVSQTGAYTLQAFEKTPETSSPVQKYSALRIRKDIETDYWVFFRGEEEFANYGPVITRGYRSNRQPSFLLDMTPGNRDDEWKDAALAVGRIFADPEAGIEVKTVRRTEDEVVVNVFIGQNVNGEPPVIDVINPEIGKTVQGAVAYEITAFDPDFGGVNGAGIDSVKIDLIRLRSDDSLNTVASAALAAPPFVLNVETSGLDDSVHLLFVTAMSTDGDTNSVRFVHIIDNTGPSAPTSVDAGEGGSPEVFALYQNYPNPFNPETSIRYSVGGLQFISLKIYDVLGREAATLVNEEMPAGSYEARWDGRDNSGRRVASGIYIYSLRAEDFEQHGRMLLLR